VDVCTLLGGRGAARPEKVKALSITYAPSKNRVTRGEGNPGEGDCPFRWKLASITEGQRKSEPPQAHFDDQRKHYEREKNATAGPAQDRHGEKEKDKGGGRGRLIHRVESGFIESESD